MPKSTPRAPKRRQETLKSGQETPKSGQKTAKSRPKDAQSLPKSSLVDPKAPLACGLRKTFCSKDPISIFVRFLHRVMSGRDAFRIVFFQYKMRVGPIMHCGRIGSKNLRKNSVWGFKTCPRALQNRTWSVTTRDENDQDEQQARRNAQDAPKMRKKAPRSEN